MRLWSIHPSYLDVKGLIALWREFLLAQKVLCEATVGYKNHPQLIRFKNSHDSLGAIAVYLCAIAKEADKRGYRFDKSKINNKRFDQKIVVTSGHIEYEWQHLLQKVKKRDPQCYMMLCRLKQVKIHPLFKKVKGDIESWEII